MSLPDFTEAVAIVFGESIVWISGGVIALSFFLTVAKFFLAVLRRYGR